MSDNHPKNEPTLFDGLVEANYVFHDGVLHPPNSALEPSILSDRPIFIHPSVIEALTPAPKDD